MNTRIMYDGWVVKIPGDRPLLCTGFFFSTRKEVIEKFEELWGKGFWKKARRRGEYKIVKVNVTMVEIE